MKSGTLEVGLKLGAHFIEVYGADCRDPSLQPVIANTNRRLLARKDNQ